jgi:hypothetical protein
MKGERPVKEGRFEISNLDLKLLTVDIIDERTKQLATSNK